MLGAGINRKAVHAEAVGRHVETVCLSIQVSKCNIIAVLSLDTVELIDDGAAHLVTDDQAVDLPGVVAESAFGLFRNVNVGQILRQAPMVVLVALGDAAPVEALCDDRVSHTEPKQLSRLQMPR